VVFKKLLELIKYAQVQVDSGPVYWSAKPQIKELKGIIIRGPKCDHVLFDA
jgi:hypothetical protein